MPRAQFLTMTLPAQCGCQGKASSMDTSFGKGPFWWDRELDFAGRPIRPDVRAAAHEVWYQACGRVQAVLGDDSDAASLMEKSVSQVSRYLDRMGSTPFSGNMNGLLVRAFCRALRRHAMKLHRIELVGNISELAEPLPTQSCASKEDCRLDAENAARRLSERGRTMLELRSVGFDWKEIGEIFKMTACAARAEFSRELKRVKQNMQSAKSSPKCPNSKSR
jgi:DNA-directed RNA polymerase specialized sigma24 family protein